LESRSGNRILTNLGAYRRFNLQLRKRRPPGVTWDGISLDKWLTDPDGFIPDNDMAFRVKNPEERAAIIDYLKDVSRK